MCSSYGIAHIYIYIQFPKTNLASKSSSIYTKYFARYESTPQHITLKDKDKILYSMSHTLRKTIKMQSYSSGGFFILILKRPHPQFIRHDKDEGENYKRQKPIGLLFRTLCYHPRLLPESLCTILHRQFHTHRPVIQAVYARVPSLYNRQLEYELFNKY